MGLQLGNVVSILVLVDVLPERNQGDILKKGGKVSILVLVDVLPELVPNRYFLPHLKSFNPCFSGCPSRTEPTLARCATTN